MRKTSVMQPFFLPWQGLFELILKSDCFVILDDYQYCPRSHHTRNKLFISKDNVGFYGVNVKKHENQSIKLNEIELSEDNGWKYKILKRLDFVYRKCKYFKDYFPAIERWLLNDHMSLAQLNSAGTIMFCKILGINTEIVYSSDYSKESNSSSRRTKRIIELLEWTKADEYLCAYGSFGYMKEDNYDYEAHPVLFQNYDPKPYKQIHSKEFIPYLSILDALFNIGPVETLELIRQGTEKWFSFEDMIKRHEVCNYE